LIALVLVPLSIDNDVLVGVAVHVYEQQTFAIRRLDGVERPGRRIVLPVDVERVAAG
jgi:hypothetical protein